MEGYIRLHKRLMDWRWYHESPMVHLLVHLILKANYSDREWNDGIVHRGQLVTSRLTLHQETGLSEKTIRTCLNRLVRTGEIVVESTNKYSIITIVKYNDYQSDIVTSGQPKATKWPADDQPAAINKKEKKQKKRSPTSSVTRTRGDGSLSKWRQEDLVNYDSIDDEIALLRASPLWREEVLLRFKLLLSNQHALDDWLVKWGQEQKISGTHHQHLGDAKRHFCSWLSIQEDKLRKNSSAYGNSNNDYRTDSELYQGTLAVMARLQAEADAGITEPLYK